MAACKGFATAAAKVTRVLVDEGGFPWAAPDLPPDAPRPWDVIPRGEYTIDGIIELSKRIADASGRAVIAAGRARSAVAPYVTERADLVSEAVDAAAAAIEALRATRIAGENCARMIHRAKAAEIEKDGDEFFKAFAQAEGLVDDADRAVADAIASADLAEKLVGEYLLDPSNANPPDKTYTDFIRETHQ